jgi:hypothetical protein
VTWFGGALGSWGRPGHYEALLPEFRCSAPAAAESALREALGKILEVVSRAAESWDIETLDDSGTTSA